MFPGTRMETPDDARETVRYFAGKGYDAIKIVRVPTGILPAIIGEATAQGMPVVGHLPSLEMPFEDIAASGMTSIEHTLEVLWSAFGGETDRAAIPAVVELIRSADLTVSTLLGQGVIAERAREQGEAFLASPTVLEIERLLGPEGITEIRSVVEQAAAGQGRVPGRPWDLAFLLDLVLALDEAGVNVVVGTDSRTAHAAPGSD